MQNLAQMQRRFAITARRPPLLLRWVLTAIFAALALIFAWATVSWLIFVIQYASVPESLLSGIGHMVLCAFVCVLAGAAALYMFPRGTGSLAAAIVELEDDETVPTTQ